MAMSYLGPYIGVTGFTRREEIDAALKAFPAQDTAGERKLMVGVLASWKSVRGLQMSERWSRQTPPRSELPKLFQSDGRVLNLVHYSLDAGAGPQDLTRDLTLLMDVGGDGLDGFQLNIPWPDPAIVRRFSQSRQPRPFIVLQVGQVALAAAGNTPKGVVKCAEKYVGCVDYLLLDPSGGLGKPFNPEWARPFLRAVEKEGLPFGLGIAGGLGPDSLVQVVPLLEEFPDISIDAQGQLRNAEHHLDLLRMAVYLKMAYGLFE